MSFKLATRWPHLAVALLAGVTGVKVYQQYGPHNINVPDIAMLAAIEPAAGHGAPGPTSSEDSATHKPAVSHSGKDLTGKRALPAVTIGGRTILTSSELRQKEQTADLGELAENAMASSLINRPWRITPFAHNPVRGPDDAKVTLLEFSDLSCAQCMPLLAKADAWLEANPDTTRHTQIHSPVGQFQDTNLAAFYGKVAQRGGTFWAYRQSLINLPDPTPEKYFNALLATGIDRTLARRLLNTESRRLYRELDADANLARKLKIGEPPSFVVGTIMLGQQGIPPDNIASVLTYRLNSSTREQNLKAAEGEGTEVQPAAVQEGAH